MSTNCKQCGSQVHRHVGLCAKCVLVAAVAGIRSEDHPGLGVIAVQGRSPTVEALNSEFVDYEFHELLGRGGSGWTFLATQKRLRRPVAVKLMRRSEATPIEAVERFQREAGVLAKLNHPNVVTVHDFGSSDNYLYIVMEYVPGSTLRTRFPTRKANEQDAVLLGLQICDALEYAHSKGLVHRDIKPENILVVKDDPCEIRVADFGISRSIANRDSAIGLTHTGLIIGTPFYMAPEQQVASKAIDHRADIYSTGVLLYELLTGQLPQGNFQPPSRLGNCSKVFDSVILKALSNDPANRFQSAAEFKERLNQIAVPVESESNAKMFTPILALIILLLLIGSVLYFNGSVRNPDEGKETAKVSSGEMRTLDQGASTTNKDSSDGKSPREIPEGYAKLIYRLGDSSTRTKRTALSSLRDLPPDPAIPEVNKRVRELLDDESPFVVREALTTLVVLDPEGCVKELQDAIRGDLSMRSHALALVVQLGGSGCVDALAAELGSSDHIRIVRTLEGLGPTSEPALLDFLNNNSNWQNALPIVESLGRIGTETSLETLEGLEGSEEAFIPAAALQAVSRIKNRMSGK